MLHFIYLFILESGGSFNTPVSSLCVYVCVLLPVQMLVYDLYAVHMRKAKR